MFSNPDCFINLENYTKNNLIEEEPDFNVYEIANKETNTKYVANIFKKNISEYAKEKLIEFSNQFSYTSKFDHPSILKYIGYSPIDFEKNPLPVVITEIPKKETLYHLFQSENYKESWKKNSSNYIIIYGIASAMSYLHSHDIIHCNLCPQNIYLDEYYYPKLTGFNCSQYISEKQTNKSINRFSKYKGYFDYFAPEIFYYKDYSKASDVFAFGVLFVEMFNGLKIEKDFDFFDYIQEILIDKKDPTSEYKFKHIPFNYHELIKKCWSYDPTKRPTFDEIVQFLRTDSNLIDNEEYQEYVKYIDESLVNFDSSQCFHLFDDIMNSSIQKVDNYLSLDNFNDEYFSKGKEVNTIFGKYYTITNRYYNDEKYSILTSALLIEQFSENDIINFSSELSIISQLNHPSIVEFYGYSPTDLYDNQLPTIINEYLPFFTLDDILNTKEPIPVWDDTQKLINIYGIASAMSYLHSHNILHRDLKPQNIYINELLFPKLSGFHLSRELPANTDHEICTEIKGTPIYLSPEVYKNKEYSKASDVYAFSYIVYEILMNKKPFENLTNVSLIFEEVVQNKKRPKISENIPESYKNLIEKCWSDDPKDRPTFNEIVDSLKIDPNFITEKINSEDYHKYVKMIEESNITFTPETKFEYEQLTDKKIQDFHKNDAIQDFKFSVIGVFETEINNISLDFKYLDLQNFEEIELIGSGSYSDVTKIRDKKTGKEYAAKYLYKNRNYTIKEYIIFSNEVNFVSQLNHPSLIKFIGYSPVNFENEPSPILVTELAPNRSLGNLIQMLQGKTEIFEWNDTKKLINIYGIASAMAYLHSNGIIYGDLKPSNILLDEYLFPKIFDFDSSFKISTLHIQGKMFGTPLYSAPEMMKDNEPDFSYDVYSYAIVVYEIITNLRPFPNCTIYDLVKIVSIQNKRLEIPNKVPICYRELIEKCWAQEPKDRPTFNEIINILRTDKRFITNDVKEEEYKNYIKYIDEGKSGSKYHKSFDINGNSDNAKTGSFSKVDLSLYLNEDNKPKEINSKAEWISLNYYEKQKEIGCGSFGTVYKIVDKKTGIVYAAKVSKIYLTQCDDEDIKNIEREISIISQLKHPAILKFIGFNKIDFKQKPKPIIVTEFIPNGSLQDILELGRENCGNPNWNDTKKLICIYGIAAGMSYLHRREILHRDLKPANILIDEYLFPKISDFGLSKIISDSNELISSGFKGSYAYSAPEIFMNEYSKAGDVYAFAIIVYEIITGESPYHNILPFQLADQVRSGFRPKFNFDIPICYKNLIERCWADNPKKRPTFDEIVELLKTDKEFITNNVDSGEFLDYIYIIDESKYDINLGSKDPIFQNSLVEKLVLSEYKYFDKIDDELVFSKFIIVSHINKNKYIATIFKSRIYKMSEQFINELEKGLYIFSKLNHPLFAKFIGYSPIDFESKQHPVVVYESESNHTLRNIIDNKKDYKLNETNKLIIIFGIAFGMRYLHSEDVIHRNLSANCIFIDEYFHPKISNLELLKDVSEMLSSKDEYFLGIYTYSAPEIFKKKYSKKSDVYAFAMITYEILTNRNIYDNIPLYKVQLDAINGKRPQFTSEIPDCYQKLIEECWSEETLKRPTFDEIVERLKSDEFKSEKIDSNLFNEYIESLEKNNETHVAFRKSELTEEKQKTKETTNHEKENLTESKKELKSSELKFRKYSVNFEQSKQISKKEQLPENKFLDLSKFKLDEIISKQDYSKTYKVVSKESGEIYSAKISTVRMNEFSRDELISLSREVNIISQLSHPSFLKFIGYSPFDFKNKQHPVIVTEMAKNGTLRHILDCERKNIHISQWNETKKLINIYGIASGMMYLHSHEILHRDLNPTNIYMDDYLFPKIGDFGLSTKNHTFDTMTYQSTTGMRGNPTYSSPEVLQFNTYTKSSDVYSFGFIVFEILSGEIPFKGIVNKNIIYDEVVKKKNRPKIPETLTESYRNLIENCWMQDGNDRPSFEEIVERLKNDSNFITEKVQKEDYYKYIKLIDESFKSFDSKKRILDLSEPIQAKSKINEACEEKQIEETRDEDLNFSHQNENNDIEKIKELAIKYSNENDTENTYIYMTKLIYQGKFEVPMEYGINLYKQGHFKVSMNYFKLLSKFNHPVANFFIGIMKYKGEGCEVDRKESYLILKKLSDNGIDIATDFIEDNF